MANLFSLNIVTPERNVFDAQVSSLVVPAEYGYLGILAHHAPLIARLIPGKVIIKDSLGNDVVLKSKSSGFLEVRDNAAVVLLDRLEEPA